VASKTKAILDAGTRFTTTQVGATLTITNNAQGQATDSSPRTSGFTVTTTVQGAGYAPPPSPQAYLRVQIAQNANANAVASAAQAVINADINFAATVNNNVITVVNAAMGAAPPPDPLITGFTTAVTTVGQSVGQTIISPTPFGTSGTWYDGIVITLEGIGPNPILFSDSSGTRFGMALPAAVVLKSSKTLSLIYNKTQELWVMYGGGGGGGGGIAGVAIVGDTADIISGAAQFTSIQAAVTAATSTSPSITLLARTFTGNVSITKPVLIIGQGFNSVIKGNFTYDTGSKGAKTDNLLFDGAVLVKTGVVNVITFGWLAATGTYLDENDILTQQNLVLLHKE